MLKRYWKDLLGNIKVDTPVESMNIMLNGWLLYQTLCSRMLAKTGYYQSGGAYGYRDQLQDCIGLKYISAEILKKQIIMHSQHHFKEGDVEHWWHDASKMGIRTRFSDDLLWLPYAVLEYIKITGDRTILDIETNFNSIAGSITFKVILNNYYDDFGNPILNKPSSPIIITINGLKKVVPNYLILADVNKNLSSIDPIDLIENPHLITNFVTFAQQTDISYSQYQGPEYEILNVTSASSGGDETL